MLKTYLYLCIDRTPNHLYNVIKLEYKQHGVSWCRKKSAKNYPTVPDQCQSLHAPFFFFFNLSGSCMINPDLLGLKSYGFVKGIKKKQEREGKRKRKEDEGVTER